METVDRVQFSLNLLLDVANFRPDSTDEDVLRVLTYAQIFCQASLTLEEKHRPACTFNDVLAYMGRVRPEAVAMYHNRPRK